MSGDDCTADSHPGLTADQREEVNEGVSKWAFHKPQRSNWPGQTPEDRAERQNEVDRLVAEVTS